ncbi:unnamed protein product [Thelazia callipaeda]|uniref:Apple domain-containing protein n=1 Tax=Thelazia callipaeda TaxID=103827 RepID=A0A0N5CQL1_THECL|nr:unnamed protein product [Thelazia callipaeda]
MTAIASMRLLLVSLSFTFTVTASQHFYDPTTRDYAEACSEMAEFAGDSFCRVFEICCRDRANNKLNGDRCQLTDPTNGCQLTLEIKNLLSNKTLSTSSD